MRKTLIALTLAFAGAAPALAQSGAAPALPMQIGQRVQLGPMMGERVVREVMVSQGGGGLTVVYDAPAGQPESKRVLRLENVNGMLEVIYDAAMPGAVALGSGGAPRLVQGGGGMYSVEYGAPR
ncbi:MAG: hypothetical protein ICV73_07885 [Acetobacteraceae bacterium]|nr:hypothetical protein [Acetobacteraceae bacterium]